ncbi:MAG: copper amine oxidase [Firmicutes bacterium]|nr:copper amine oxidase [Bacillota bacterium]
MKKLILALLVQVFLLTSSLAPPVLAQEPNIPVLVDGLSVAFDVQPVIQNGRTLVPFRATAEALNVKVSWNSAAQTITASDAGTSIWLQIGSQTARVNDSYISLDVPPQIINGRTLIPLRFFSEAFNCKVAWDSSINGVRIATPAEEMSVVGFYALGDSGTSSWTDLFGRPYPESAAGNTDAVSELALGWYSLDKDGSLLTRSRTGWQRPDGYEKVLATAGEYRMKTEMVVHLTDGDGAITSLLASEAAMTRAADSIAAEARLYQGVNLDFEGLGFQDEGARLRAVQDSFTRFVKILSERTRAAGRGLTLTLHAPNSSYPGYDYQALGALADRIIIMAYDYGSTPEPVSLVRQAVEQAAALVPSEKLLLGISAPSETAESIPVKVGIAKRYKLAGVAIWRLGLVSDEMWGGFRSAVAAKKTWLSPSL